MGCNVSPIVTNSSFVHSFVHSFFHFGLFVHVLICKPISIRDFNETIYILAYSFVLVLRWTLTNITNVSSTNNEIPPPDNIVLLVDDQPSQSDVLSPKQSLVPRKLPSAIQQSQQSTNKGAKNGYYSSLKASSPCPFLIRRGRCLINGNRCDFKHPKPSQTQKCNIPCPFLQKRGYCLKKNRCDFSPDPIYYLGNYAHPDSFLSHRQWLFARSEEGKNIKNTCKKAWKIVSHNKL